MWALIRNIDHGASSEGVDRCGPFQIEYKSYINITKCQILTITNIFFTLYETCENFCKMLKYARGTICIGPKCSTSLNTDNSFDIYKMKRKIEDLFPIL